MSTTIQSQIHRIFSRDTTELWSRDKICLKLCEELGELSQAFRKKTREEQVGEFEDVLTALMCLAERENICIDDAIVRAIRKLDEFVT